MKISGKSTLYAVMALAALSVAAVAVADHHGEDEAITQAVLNYANAVYEVKPKLIDESVHLKVQKVGYVPKKDGSGYKETWMTHAELKELTSHWNKDGHIDPATAKREIKILDKLDQTATVRLGAEWGVDYIHLVKSGKKWMIMNVVWQTYPAE